MTDQTAVPTGPAKAPSLIWNLISTAILAAWIGWQMGWVWALAGVVGVLVHEYGHVLAMNALGSGPGRIQIVPFMGGAAVPARPPLTDFRGVVIALAGPVFGLLAMIPFVAASAFTGDGRWLGGAFFVAVINLLNLAPAPPLDGSKAIGPALARIHPWLEKVVLVAVGALVLLWSLRTGQWLIGGFIALGIVSAVMRPRMRAPARPLSAVEWIGAVALYVAALALCVWAVGFSMNAVADSPAVQTVRHLAGA